MKATIIRADGTRIEAEGTPEEIAKLAGAASETRYVYLPSVCTRPHVGDWYPVQTIPYYPTWPVYPQHPTTWPTIICSNSAGTPLLPSPVPSDPFAMAQS